MYTSGRPRQREQSIALARFCLIWQVWRPLHPLHIWAAPYKGPKSGRFPAPWCRLWLLIWHSAGSQFPHASTTRALAFPHSREQLKHTFPHGCEQLKQSFLHTATSCRAKQPTYRSRKAAPGPGWSGFAGPLGTAKAAPVQVCPNFGQTRGGKSCTCGERGAQKPARRSECAIRKLHRAAR